MAFPFVMLKAAISLDGYLDDCSQKRLLLSSPEDFLRVDELRSKFDAILVGSETIRKDNPTLRIKDTRWVEKRKKEKLPPQPIRVTLSASGNLPQESLFFSDLDVQKLIYCPTTAFPFLETQLSSKGTVIAIDSAEDTFVKALLTDLANRNIRKLLVEGGARIHRLFLESNFVNELRVSIAPFFITEPNAPKFVSSGSPMLRRMLPIHTDVLGDTVVVHYRPSRDSKS